MPAWDDYKTDAKARGALALELYVAQSTPAAPPETVKANLADHLAYQAKLEAAGQLVMAGPLSDESGEMMEGAGQMVYRAASFDEAKALVANDPMHLSGARSYSIRKWLVNEGGLTMTVRFAEQSVDVS
jgi:uncharacterized protein YciI